MITYLVTERYANTIARLLAGLGADAEGLISVRFYEQLFLDRVAPIGHLIFTDFDRLSRYEVDQCVVVASALAEAAPEAKILNHPFDVCERVPLLTKLHRAGINDFEAIRIDDGSRPARFPLFIRAEDGHAGVESDIITDDEQYDAALARMRQQGKSLKGRVTVGYVGERSPDGFFRKYGAFNIGGTILPQHILFGNDWAVKGQAAWFGSKEAAEELAYVEENPHADLLLEAFRIGGIDFGRADFGYHQGRMQIYEVNTNPTFPNFLRDDFRIRRRAVIREKFLAALRAIDTPHRNGHFTFDDIEPRMHDLRPLRPPAADVALMLAEPTVPQEPAATRLVSVARNSGGAETAAGPVIRPDGQGKARPAAATLRKVDQEEAAVQMNRLAGSSLCDPSSRGEDLVANLRLAAVLAPRLCPGCAGYHVRVPSHRLVGEKTGTSTDERELGLFIRETVKARLKGPGAEDLKIVVAGSADTALLSIAAHTVALLGADMLARCHFTVLDLCPTPLELCKAFARQNGLSLETAIVDLKMPDRRFEADLLILHSVFRFIPSAIQADVLRTLAGWLRPGGTLLFSNRLRSHDPLAVAADRKKRQAANDRVRDLLVNAPATADLDWDDLMPRLDRSLLDDQTRPGELGTEDEVAALLRTSGLAVASMKTVAKPFVSGMETSYRKRVLAILRS